MVPYFSDGTTPAVSRSSTMAREKARDKGELSGNAIPRPDLPPRPPPAPHRTAQLLSETAIQPPAAGITHTSWDRDRF